MKILTCWLFVFGLVGRVFAFEWPGGPMTVTVVCRGHEEFMGMVPKGPWGTSTWTQDPILELRDGGDRWVASRTITGTTIQWYQGGRREQTVSFDVPAGTYVLIGHEGTRHIRVPGEGYSGFRMTFESIVEPEPPVAANAAPSVVWTSAPASVESGQGFWIAARGTDADGNLAQVVVLRDGGGFAAAGAGNGFASDAGGGGSETGPRTITFTAQAIDAAGAGSPVITHTLTVNAPVPVQYTLATAAGPGGTVTAGGTYTAGTVVWISAMAQATHDFVGWTGAAGGMANPVAITMDGDKTLQANFALRSYALTTSVSGGGTVTAGGSYPYGSVVTVSASADAAHYFVGWGGDATGNASPTSVLLDRAKNVQAVFAPKAAQTILFSSPGNQPIGTEVQLSATSSAGLPVGFELVSGPATLSGNSLTVTGVGAITVRAVQTGDATRLPAVPVAVSFNGVAAAAVVRVQSAAKTLLAGRETTGSGQHFVLGNP